MPKISVIVPCYNGADLLPRCLDSLLKQTLELHQIIIVNDGSSDNTLSVSQAYANKYPNICVVNKQNQGLPQARKTGILNATGDFVGFVDSDDWIEPQMYHRLYETTEANQADIAACELYKTYTDGHKQATRQELTDGIVLSVDQAFHMLHSRKGIFPYMCNKLFRRELFDDVIFPEGNFTGEDYITIVQVLPKAKKIVTVREPLYNYWQGDVSMSRGGFKESHLLSYRQYQKAAKNLIAAYPFMKDDVCCYLAVEYMAYVIAMSRNQNYNAQVLEEVQVFVRTHLPALLKNKHCPLLYKGSAVAFSIHSKLLTTAYQIIHHINQIIPKKFGGAFNETTFSRLCCRLFIRQGRD